MGNVGVLMLIVFVVAFWITVANQNVPWTKFWETGDFWATWLPTWMQGVGTVAAALVGLRALAVWRQQDRAKRKADFAMEVQRAADDAFHKARLCYLPAIVPEMKLTPQNDLIQIYVTGAFKQRVAECKEAHEKLYLYFKMAHEYLGNECSKGIWNLEVSCRQYPRAQKNLTRLAGETDKSVIEGEEWQADVKKRLKGLGISFKEGAEIFNIDWERGQDPLLFEGYDELSLALKKIIMLDDVQ
jgi:hypothetical protein